MINVVKNLKRHVQIAFVKLNCSMAGTWGSQIPPFLEGKSWIISVISDLYYNPEVLTRLWCLNWLGLICFSAIFRCRTSRAMCSKIKCASCALKEHSSTEFGLFWFSVCLLLCKHFELSKSCNEGYMSQTLFLHDFCCSIPVFRL